MLPRGLVEASSTLVGNGIEIRERGRNAGTDIAGLRTAAISSTVAAAGAWVDAVASRSAVPALLLFIASVPFAPLALFALALAF